MIGIKALKMAVYRAKQLKNRYFFAIIGSL